ncbi:hypothetical protein [Nocardia tengchongensis]|uniref:hypothetical protein n=1 Tax=Nocardia tengchongensis TaxID=2055889 RepID=UPI0036AF5F76
MTIVLAATLLSLLMFATAVGARDNGRHSPQLTVADIQARLAAEPPRTYTRISRGW